MKSLKYRQILLFSPGVLILIPILIQYLLWLNLDGNNIIRLYREDSTYANLIFFWYVALVLLGIISASKKRIRIQQRFYSSKNIKLYIGWCFFIFCIAGLIFSRNHTDILYSIISFNLQENVNYADLTSNARSETLPGITSFTFIGIFIVSSCIYCWRALNSSVHFILFTTIVFSALIGFAFGGRITFLFNMFAGAWIFSLFSKMHENRLNLAKTFIYFLIGIIFLILVFASFEYIRKWQSVDQSMYSYFDFISDYMTVPYLAKNHYNSVIFFDTPVNYTLIGSSPFFIRIATFLGFEDESFTFNLIRDLGPHGTVLVFALWYQDMGLIVSSFAIFLLSYLSQSVFLSAINNRDFHSSILYAILVPGLLSMCRANYFGNVAFVVNLIALYGFLVFSKRIQNAAANSNYLLSRLGSR